MRLLFWVIVILVAVAAALFAVSNREAVELAFWPLPFALDLPLYLAVLLALLTGLLFGGLLAWIAGRHWRREVRLRGHRIAALERELAATQARLAETSVSAPALPAIQRG